MTSSRRNNFDLLRVAAALQVVQLHATEHLHLAAGPVGQAVNGALGLFPGVPIFFVVSGFLISQSYERSPDIRTYARNRVLRIYPALWTCFGVSLALLAGFGALSRTFVASSSFWMWIAGQLTVVQFFNPNALRTFGVGVVNGSLWTIPVEIEFYILLPVLYRWCVEGRSRRGGTTALSSMAILSFGVWCVWQLGVVGSAGSKLLQVTLAPHLFMFLLGTMMQRNWDRLAPFLEGRAPLWIGVYVAERMLERALGGAPISGAIGAVRLALMSATWIGLLALLVVSVAHTWTNASQRTLRGHDISYGVYVYHMLIVNACVQLRFTGSMRALAVVYALTFVAATASWVYIERPALRLKQRRPRAVAAVRSVSLTAALPTH